MNFKSLTYENWLVPDVEVPATLKFFDDDEPRAVGGEEWMNLCRADDLHLKVPRSVRTHFEAARGALVYGYFFCPLYTLAVEQLHRAAECAVLQKCKETNCRVVDQKGRTIDVYQGLAWLRRIEIISKEEFHDWDEIRRFRDRTISPHPKKAAKLPPPGAIADQLKLVAGKINALFK